MFSYGRGTPLDDRTIVVDSHGRGTLRFDGGQGILYRGYSQIQRSLANKDMPSPGILPRVGPVQGAYDCLPRPPYNGTSLMIRKRNPLAPYRRPLPRVLGWP